MEDEIKRNIPPVEVQLPENTSQFPLMALSRDTCKNLQDGLKTPSISSFQGF